MRKKKSKIDLGVPLMNRSISLPKEGVISVDDLQFDIKFEHSLFRSKSNSNLSHTIFYLEKFKSFIPSKSSSFSKEEK